MKTRRHAKILELIQERPIDTQEELLKWLRTEKFDVTQATISRDIKELRLVKSMSSDGRYRYTTGKNEEGNDVSSKFHHLFTTSAKSVDYAGNTVVIKCMAGMAQAVCASMDSMTWENMVGTISGDDTIFILMRNENSSIKLVSDLKKLFSGR